MKLNRMPNITWHKLKMNEAEVELPNAAIASPVAIQTNIPKTLCGEPGVFDTALDTALQAADGMQTWETGMGEAADEWLVQQAIDTIAIVVPEGQAVEDTLIVRIEAQDSASAVANLDIVAQSRASVKVAVHVDSPTTGSGVAGVRTRVFVADDAWVHIDSVQTLDATWQHLDNVGAHVADRGHFSINQTVLGAAESYTGLSTNLAGQESKAEVDTRYLGHGANKIDFNYVIRQRGVASTCNLTANGVLMDSSAKVLRGTIDLIHGAKGAVGQENETVLLVNEDVRNKTIPIILCDEDDVQGAHGATIGHVNPEQLGYLRTRGLTSEQVEDLFAVASFDYAAAHAFDEQTTQAVERLGATVLGPTYEAVREGE